MARRPIKRKPKLRSFFEDKGKDFLERMSTNFGYEVTKLPYELNYVVDFTLLSKKDGHPIYLEFKGYFSPEDRRKMKAVRKANPLLDIRFVFMRDNPLTKGSKTKYSDWCKKNGYPLVHIVGKDSLIIPKDWLKECQEVTVKK